MRSLERVETRLELAHCAVGLLGRRPPLDHDCQSSHEPLEFLYLCVYPALFGPAGPAQARGHNDGTLELDGVVLGLLGHRHQ